MLMVHGNSSNSELLDICVPSFMMHINNVLFNLLFTNTL